MTAIDDGTIPNAWGSINIDDEGTPARRNVLIENGVLKNYMVDRFNGRRMGMPSTGSARRQSYAYVTTSRMTNTYIAPGTDRNEDIIGSIEYGLYAKEMGGGSVNPLTGEFNFAVNEGYMIRNGKVCESRCGAPAWWAAVRMSFRRSTWWAPSLIWGRECAAPPAAASPPMWVSP